MVPKSWWVGFIVMMGHGVMIPSSWKFGTLVMVACLPIHGTIVPRDEICWFAPWLRHTGTLVMENDTLVLA